MKKVVLFFAIAAVLTGCDTNFVFNINMPKEEVKQSEETEVIAFFNGNRYKCIEKSGTLTTCRDASGNEYSAIILEYDL